jgi:hypothetical protein
VKICNKKIIIIHFSLVNFHIVATKKGGGATNTKGLFARRLRQIWQEIKK